MIKKSYIFFVALLLLNSCSSKFDGKNGTETIYYPNTSIVKQTVEYKDGKRNGASTIFYKTGRVCQKCIYLNDEIKDSVISYASNGNLAEIKIIINKRREGCWKKYNEEGNEYSSVCYRNDELNGPSITHTYKTGRLLTFCNFKDGVKDGKQEEYYNSGKLKNITYFNNGFYCLGTEEYTEGFKNNLDFKINIEEQNQVLINNTFNYKVRLENMKEDDMVYRVDNKDSGRCLTQIIRLVRVKDFFLLSFVIHKGDFIMEKVKLAAYRKTSRGNIAIKTIEFNAAANNY